MTNRQNIIVVALVVLIVAAFATSYFVKPRLNITEVGSFEDISLLSQSSKTEHNLADRIAGSYLAALVLEESQYSQKNAIALDALRTWAKNNFEKDPFFLYPTSPTFNEPCSNILGCVCSNLFSQPVLFLDSLATKFVVDRIAQFHESGAYKSFQSDYFDLYGKDIEAKLLLKRYQLDKAKLAISVLLTAVFWLIAIIVGMWVVMSTKRDNRWRQTQRMLACGWLLLSLFYFAIAWQYNQVSIMVSALFCGVVGAYICKPIVLTYTESEGLGFTVQALSARTLAFCLWMTLTLVGIQVLTWIRTGSFNYPDPITLLISSLSGNFLHDPINVKKNIARIIGLGWIVSGLWAAKAGLTAETEIDDQLSSLNPSV